MDQELVEKLEPHMGWLHNAIGKMREMGKYQEDGCDPVEWADEMYRLAEMGTEPRVLELIDLLYAAKTAYNNRIIEEHQRIHNKGGNLEGVAKHE